MDAIANLNGIGGRVAAGDGQALRRSAIAKADIQAGTIPTVAVAVDEVEDHVAGVLDDAGTFSNETAVGIQGEGQRQLLGRGACSVNSDVEHASGDTRRVDGAHFECVVFDGDIFAR